MASLVAFAVPAIVGFCAPVSAAAPPAQGAFGATVPATAHRPALVPLRYGGLVMGTPANEVGRDEDEQRLTAVRLTRGFYIAETEVTQGQYRALMGTNPSWFSGAAGDDERPVEQVSWLDAIAYCNALSAAEGLALAYTIFGAEVTWHREAPGYRLPTEAEWEYAARAGSRGATYAGDLDLLGQNHAPVLDAIAWYSGNSGVEHPKAWDSSGWPDKQYPHTSAATHPVKGKQPNAWGLYDTLGNVWEWTWDRFVPGGPARDDGRARIDPAGPMESERRSFRGGSFGLRARFIRAGARDGDRPDVKSFWIGLRPVRTR